MRSENQSKNFISTLWVVLFAFIMVAFLGVFASSFIKVENNDEPNTSTKANIEGKYISFMGDSITTYSGWSNNTSYNSTIGSNVVWYNSDRLSSVNFTWWKKTIDKLDLKLCVNNSWSGSQVTTTQGENAAACMSRAENLHNDNKTITPDIIVVYIGINDFNRGITLGSFDGVSDIYDSSTKTYTGDLTEFADAYATMVHKIVSTYKKADVYLCTLVNYNTALTSWNAEIEKIANAFDCNVVDFYNETGINSSNKGTYTLDTLHPNQSGMSKMSACLIASLQENYN